MDNFNSEAFKDILHQLYGETALRASASRYRPVIYIDIRRNGR